MWCRIQNDVLRLIILICLFDHESGIRECTALCVLQWDGVLLLIAFILRLGNAQCLGTKIGCRIVARRTYLVDGIYFKSEASTWTINEQQEVRIAQKQKRFRF